MHFSKISLAWTNEPSAEPNPLALAPGELVLNRSNGKLFYRQVLQNDPVGVFFSTNSFAQGLQTTQVFSTLTTDLTQHIQNTNNPHQVTANQLDTYTEQEFDLELDNVIIELQENLDDVEEKVDHFPLNDVNLEENLFVTKTTKVGGQFYNNQIINLGSSGTITPNLNESNIFRITRNASITLENPNNLKVGTYTLIVHRGNGEEITWGSKYIFSDDPPVFSEDSNFPTDIITMISDGDNLYCSIRPQYA